MSYTLEVRRLRRAALSLPLIVACVGDGHTEPSSPLSYVDLATVEPVPIIELVAIPDDCVKRQTLMSVEPIPCCERAAFADALRELAVRCALVGGNSVTSGLDGCWNECHIDDLEHGPTIVWFSDGRMKRESTYFHGVKVGLERTWHENGQLYTLTEFNRDGTFGCHSEWDEDGKLLHTINCR